MKYGRLGQRRQDSFDADSRAKGLAFLPFAQRKSILTNIGFLVNFIVAQPLRGEALRFQLHLTAFFSPFRGDGNAVTAERGKEVF